MSRIPVSHKNRIRGETRDRIRSELNISESINSHINDFNNPHSVTKSQVGLSEVDNTSDVNKPVSTAQQTALDLKADISSLGTAAYEDITTSSTDTTAGSVTKVGDFGIGSTTGIPVGAVSLDTLTEVGEYYYSNTATNVSNAGTFGTLSVRVVGTAAGYQIAHQTSNPAGTYTRAKSGTGFADWFKVLTDGNTNLNEFGGLVNGDYIAQGFALTSTYGCILLPISSTTAPTSVTITGGFNVVRFSSNILATNPTLTLNAISSNKLAILLFQTTGLVEGTSFNLMQTSNASKITVNF